MSFGSLVVIEETVGLPTTPPFDFDEEPNKFTITGSAGQEAGEPFQVIKDSNDNILLNVESTGGIGDAKLSLAKNDPYSFFAQGGGEVAEFSAYGANGFLDFRVDENNATMQIAAASAQTDPIFEIQDDNFTGILRMVPGTNTLQIGDQNSLNLASSVDNTYLSLTGSEDQTGDVLQVGSWLDNLLEITGDNKIGFYGHAPVVQQTGVAVTLAAIHAALVNLGLITA